MTLLGKRTYRLFPNQYDDPFYFDQEPAPEVERYECCNHPKPFHMHGCPNKGVCEP